MRTYFQKACICWALLLSLSPAQAQLQTAWWFLQDSFYLDFLTDPPTVQNLGPQSPLSTVTSSMCNENGDLRFAGDFSWVADRNLNVMPGSQPLISAVGPSRLVGQVLAVETDVFNQYVYVIGDGLPGAMDRSWRIRTVRVDMSQRGGLGDVRAPTQELLFTDDISVFAGGYACEADQYWLVIALPTTLQGNQTTFHAHRLVGTEFVDTPVVSVVTGVEYNHIASTAGNGFRFSPNLRRLLLTEQRVGNGRVSVLDFDPFTGVVSNPVPIGNFWDNVWALEFSPNSEIAYVADVDTLSQYDLSVSPPAKTILASGITATGDVPFSYTTMQLGLDGALYVSSFNRDGIDAVLQPNVPGTGADFQRDYIPLPTPRREFRLPYFGAHYFNIPVIEGELQADTSICPFDSIQLVNSLQSDGGFLWSPAEFVDDPTAQEPMFAFGDFPESDTVITMTVLIQKGTCSFPKKVNITLKGQPEPPRIGGSPVVCPFVDSVRYWIEEDSLGGNVEWLVDGGEILSGQGTDTVRVNWFDSNTQAEVQVIRTDLECRPDTGRLSVRIKIRLEPAFPEGIDLSCWEPGTVLRYETFPPTQGSVYTWGTTNGGLLPGRAARW